VSFGGKAPASGWVRVVFGGSAAGTADVWVQADGSGNWTLPATDLSSRPEGSMTFTASLVTGNGSTTVVAGSTGDIATAIHDTTLPTLAVNPVTTTGKPTISGTSSDIPVGSALTVTVDPNGDGVLTDLVTYTVLVGAGGAWSVNTAVVQPTSGTVPSSGFTSYAKVTATGSDAAGNSLSTVAITRPTVNLLTTNDTTPTITGTWGGTNSGSDSLEVTVNSVAYNTGNGLVINDKSWSITIPGGNALAVANDYDVTAVTTRGADTAADGTSAELDVITGPSVTITSAASQTTTKPTITGQSSILSGTLTVRIDPNNDGTFTDAIYYTVATDAGGNWSLNTGTTFPISGTFPIAGLTGPMGILVTATDGGGQSNTAAQTLSVVTLSITGVTTTATATTAGTVDANTVFNNVEDGNIQVTGTTTNIADGQTVTITIADSDTSTARRPPPWRGVPSRRPTSTSARWPTAT